MRNHTTCPQNLIKTNQNKHATIFTSNLTATQLFEKQVKSSPDNIALSYLSQNVTYSELQNKADILAVHLQNQGISAGSIVTAFLENGINAVVSMLAILKVGCIYLPLDPLYPAERINHILQDSQTHFIITNNKWVSKIASYSIRYMTLECDYHYPAAQARFKKVEVRSQDPAYVIYTSGSTGKPKGVVISHCNLINMAQAQIQELEINSSSHILQFAPISYDASIWEIWSALASGAQLCIFRRTESFSTQELIEMLREESVSVMTLSPSVLRNMPNEDFPALEVIVSAGEACTKDIVEKWKNVPLFINAYGPSEITVCATLKKYRYGNANKITIGKPIANVKTYILDEQLNSVPVGTVGELYVGGAGVGQGYHNRPELTAERFIQNPFNDAPDRLYKTGDLVRLNEDQELEFIGRCDDQVKIRGFRVELGEVEQVILTHSAICHASVTVSGDRLMAYLVIHENQAELNLKELKLFLQNLLPHHMIPTEFIIIEKMPMTANDKVDRRKLSEMQGKKLMLNQQGSGNLTTTEASIASIWSQLLKINIKEINKEDSFFDLGGTSLTVIKMIATVNDLFNIELDLAKVATKSLGNIASVVNYFTADGQSHSTSSIEKPTTSYLIANKNGTQEPLVLIHPAGGSAVDYLGLSSYMRDRPIYGMNDPRFGDPAHAFTSIEVMAKEYIAILDKLGILPTNLGGWSFGGVVAFEIARQLEARGHYINQIFLIDAFNVRALSKQPKFSEEDMDRILNAKGLNKSSENYRKFLFEIKHNEKIELLYQPQTIKSKIILLKAVVSDEYLKNLKLPYMPYNGWENLSAQTIEVYTLPCTHTELFSSTHVPIIAEYLTALLEHKIALAS